MRLAGFKLKKEHDCKRYRESYGGCDGPTVGNRYCGERSRLPEVSEIYNSV
ncbi:unnamed protein product, partial [Allacma fusca]